MGWYSPGDLVRRFLKYPKKEEIMFDSLISLVDKNGGISLVKNLFCDLEDLISNFEHDLLIDKNIKNAVIDSLIAVLQKQKS